MAATRTPGITIGADGRFFIDKRYRGIRIGMRVGSVTQDQAEQRLLTEMQHIDFELARRAHRHPTFADCARRYLAQSQDMRSLEAIRIHVELLVEHIGHLEPHQVHDATLAPLISKRIADRVCAVTINRTLEVARTILHRAARSYRDEHGRPWLDALPPLITMLPESPRSPYPITWEEQDRLFPKLPAHLARMALFSVNTGLRDSNLCGLQWGWEVPVPEIVNGGLVFPRNDGIRVVLVEPGYTRTSFENNLWPADQLDAYTPARNAVQALMHDVMKTADSPEVVANAILKAATAPHPRRRYTAGALARQISFLRRFVPASPFDRSLRKQLRLPS